MNNQKPKKMKNLPVWIFLAICVAIATASSPAPAPSKAPECADLVFDMADCLSYMTGDASTPSKSCCSGFQNVVQVNATCICFALQMGPTLGIQINMTRAEQIPKICGVQAPPITMCNTPTAPARAPATSSPSPAPKFPPRSAPTPKVSPPPTVQPSNPPSETPKPAVVPSSSPSETPNTAEEPSNPPSETPAADSPPPAGKSPGSSDHSRIHPKFAVVSVALIGWHLFHI